MMLMEDFRRSSDTEIGLELVDIVPNATRRALTGTLRVDGWKGLPGLMVERPDHYITLVALHDRKLAHRPVYTPLILKHFRSGGRSRLAPPWQD